MQIKQEIQDVLDSYVRQTMTGNLEGIERYFSTDDRFYWVEDGRIQYPSRDSLVAGIRQFSATVDTIDMQVGETRIDVLSQDYANLYAEFNEEVTLNSGMQFTLDGAMTVLVIHEEETWKFLIGHTSVKRPR